MTISGAVGFTFMQQTRALITKPTTALSTTTKAIVLDVNTIIQMIFDYHIRLILYSNSYQIFPKNVLAFTQSIVSEQKPQA